MTRREILLLLLVAALVALAFLLAPDVPRRALP